MKINSKYVFKRGHQLLVGLRGKFFTNIKEFVFRIYVLDRIKLIHSTFLMFLRRWKYCYTAAAETEEWEYVRATTLQTKGQWRRRGRKCSKCWKLMELPTSQWWRSWGSCASAVHEHPQGSRDPPADHRVVDVVFLDVSLKKMWPHGEPLLNKVLDRNSGPWRKPMLEEVGRSCVSTGDPCWSSLWRKREDTNWSHLWRITAC